MQAAGNCDATDWAHAAVEELLVRQTGHDPTMRKALMAHLERSCRDRFPGDSPT